MYDRAISQVMYSFHQDTPTLVRSTFSLDSGTGVITLDVPINFENGTMFYDFSVVAEDGGSMSSTATVRSELPHSILLENVLSFPLTESMFKTSMNLLQHSVKFCTMQPFLRTRTRL